MMSIKANEIHLCVDVVKKAYEVYENLIVSEYKSVT